MKKASIFLSLLATSAITAYAQVAIGQTAAQGQINGGALIRLLQVAQDIVTRLIPFAVGVAVLSFFWFLIKYIMQGGESSDAKAASLKGMGTSILALFVMVSIWGIVGFFGSIFGIGQGGTVPIPTVQVPG